MNSKWRVHWSAYYLYKYEFLAFSRAFVVSIWFFSCSRMNSKSCPLKKKNIQNSVMSAQSVAEFEQTNDYVTSKMCLAWGQHKYCSSVDFSRHFQLEHGHSQCSAVFVPTNNKIALARNELVRNHLSVSMVWPAAMLYYALGVKSNKNCIISAGISQFPKRFSHFRIRSSSLHWLCLEPNVR